MTSVAIIGAAGRMGRALIKGISELDELRLAAAVEQEGHPDIGRDAGELAGMESAGIRIAPSAEGLGDAQVAIDFSLHDAVPANVKTASDVGIAYVLGTTGLTDEEAEAVRAAAERLAVVWSPNMSLGMNVLFAAVERAASVLGTSFDVEIADMHHRHKRDAPSGTAMGLAEHVAKGRGQNLARVVDYGRHGITGEREPGRIGIHALRGGSVVGDHTVYFAGEGECLEFVHRAAGREIFARGALRAATWVAGKPAGLYGMADVLGLAAP